MNYAISINSTSINIQHIQNDNSHIIRGHGPEGYIDRSVQKDDPDCEAKVRQLLTQLYEHQQAELAGYVQEAPAKLEAEHTKLQEHLEDVFGGEEKPPAEAP